jgi:hypothetical protein
LKQLDNTKAYTSLSDMVIVLEQLKHLKNFMEGKTSTISNLTKEQDKEELYVNKLGVYNPRYLVKNPPFYVSMKIMDKIAHFCLIDGGSGLNVMSRILMEEPGLSCTNENFKSMVSYNSQQHTTIGEIKDVTLVFCAHLEIMTTSNIQVIDMPMSEYFTILGRD